MKERLPVSSRFSCSAGHTEKTCCSGSQRFCHNPMKHRSKHKLAIGCLAIGVIANVSSATIPPEQLDNFDLRKTLWWEPPPNSEKVGAFERLRAVLPDIKVDFDPVSRSPRYLWRRLGCLTDAHWQHPQRLDRETGPYAALEAFLDDNRALFGYGSEALGSARISFRGGRGNVGMA